MSPQLGLSGLGLGMGVAAGGGVSESATVAITSAESVITALSPFSITVTFSKSVTGFVVGDITVGNGSAGNFAGSGAVYTADITPTAAGTVTVDIGADVVAEGNEAATRFSIVSIVGAVSDYDFSDLSVLFQDSGGTTPVTANNDPIGKVTDKSGNNNHVTQGTGASRPLWKANVKNGLGAGYGDGTSNYFLQTGAIAVNQPYTRIIVCKSNTASITTTFFDGRGDAEGLFRVHNSFGYKWNIYAGTADVFKGTADTNWHIFSVIYNGASSEIRMDGASLGTGNPGVTNATGTTLFRWGATNAVGTKLNGYIGRHITFSGALTAPQMSAIEEALNAQWDVYPFELGVIISLDDGYTSTYNEAYAYAHPRGIKGTLYCKTDKPDTAGDDTGVGAPTWAELETMNENGDWDIANHSNSHPHFNSMTQAQIEAELTTAKNTLETHGMTRASRHFAYPFGEGFDDADTLAALAASGMLTARTITGGAMHPATVDPYQLEIYAVGQSDSAATVIGGIQNALAGGNCFMLMLHDINDSGGTYQWDVAKWRALVDWLEANAIKTYTISEYYAIMVALGNP